MTLTPEKVNGNLDQPTIFIRRISGLRHVGLNLVDLGGLFIGFGLLTVLVAALFGAVPALVMLGTVVAGVLLAAAVVRPAIALVLLIVFEFSNAGEVLAVKGVFAGMLGLGFLSILVALRQPLMRARLRRPPWAPILLMACYFVTLLPSIRYTLAPNSTDEWLEFFSRDVLLMVIVLVLAHLVARPWWIAAAIVTTLSVLAALTIVNQVALGAAPSTFLGFAKVSDALGEMIITPRHSGPVSDSNFWGRNLILGLTLSYALTYRSAVAQRRLPQVGWGLATVALLGGVYLTQSRGTMLSTLVASMVWVIASGPQVRKRALQASPFIMLVLLIPGIGNRLVNLSDAFEDVPAYAIDPSLVQRSAAQEIAAIVFADNPLFGTGPGSFASVIYEYSAQSGDLLIGPTRAQHNTYLEVASESGVVGLVGWFVLVGGIAVLACRTLLRLVATRQSGRRGMPTRALAAGALAVVVGWSTASLFLHIEYFRPLLIVFALIGAMAKQTEVAAATQLPNEIRATQRSTRGLVVGSSVALACAIVVMLGSVLLTGLSEPRYRVQALITLLPAPNTYTSYGIDVRNRVPVMPAYAAMIQSMASAHDVRVDAEPEKGIITMIAEGGTLAEAEGRLRPAMAEAPAAIARFRGDLQYRVVPLARPEVIVEPSYSPRAILISSGAVLAGLAVVALVVGWQGRRRGWFGRDPSPRSLIAT